LLRVLKANDVVVLDQGDGKTFSILRDDFAEVKILEGEIQPKMIRYFWRKLGIAIHHFWHPEMAEADQEARRKKLADSNDKALE
jgi:hypothetical protein